MNMSAHKGSRLAGLSRKGLLVAGIATSRAVSGETAPALPAPVSVSAGVTSSIAPAGTVADLPAAVHVEMGPVANDQVNANAGANGDDLANADDAAVGNVDESQPGNTGGAELGNTQGDAAPDGESGKPGDD
jgi:hypothetical protein